MSGFDIVGVVAAAMQFSSFIAKTVIFINYSRNASKAHYESLVDLDSKLRLFQTALDSLKRAAQTIKSSKYRTEIESSALVPMNQNIKESENTLHELFTCKGRYQKPKDRSTLLLVVDYWVFDHRGKAIVENGIREIVDRVESIKFIVSEINTHVANDARNTAHDTIDLLLQMQVKHPRSIRTLSNGSAASTTSVTSNSMFESLENKWDINVQMYEELASQSSGLSVAIISAINEKNCKMVAELLKSGEDPLAKGDSGWCVFHYALRADSKTVMRELLKSKKVKDNRGFDIRDIHGGTALHFAALLGMKKMARELLIAGSDRNALNNSGYSPLSVAVKEKEAGIVEVLLDYKAECIPPNPKRLKIICEDIKYIKDQAT